VIVMKALLLLIAATALVTVVSGCAALKPDPRVASPRYPPYHQIAGSVDSGGIIAGTGGGGFRSMKR
jgi:hypothetical protein